MDGQTERTIQELGDTLRACAIDYGENWDKFLTLCELSYNNIYFSRMYMVPFELLHGKGCRSLLDWFELPDVNIFGVDLVNDAQDKVRSIQAILLAVHNRQMKYVDYKVKDTEFQTDKNDLLKISPMKG